MTLSIRCESNILDDTHDSTFRYIATYTLLCIISLIVGVSFGIQNRYPDYEDYITMALGNSVIVTDPVASRPLGPFLAGLLSRYFKLPIHTALAAVCFGAWVACGVLASLVLRATKVPIHWAVVMATLPYPAVAAAYYLVPDGVSVLFVLLALYAALNERYSLVTLGTMLSSLSRNTSFVAIGLWAFLAARRRRTILILAVSAGLVLSITIKKLAGIDTTQNIHQMNSVLYYLAKPLVNGIKNLSGFAIYGNPTNWCKNPSIVFDVSAIPGMGRITQIGICSFVIWKPIYSILCYAFLFGVIPALVIRNLISPTAEGRTAYPDNIRLRWMEALPFLIMFFMAPTFGISTKRLFVESYPLLFPLVARVIPPSPDTGRLRTPLICLGYNIIGHLIFLRW